MAITRRGFFTKTAIGTTALAIPAALAACAAPGGAGTQASGAPAVKFDQPTTITFWHTQTGPNEEALKAMAAKFNSSNGKNITVTPELQGNYTQVYQKIMSSIQAGSPPDVAVAYESMVAEYMKANAVVDLEDYAIKGPQAFSKESLDDIFPAYISSNRYPAFGNKMLSFPFTKSLAVDFYNDDRFKAAGITKYGQDGTQWTFADFKKAMAAVSKPGSVFGVNIAIDTSYIDAFTYANGGELLTNDNSKVLFTQGPMVEVFDMWGQMVKDGQAYAAEGRNYQPDFGNGKVASFHQSSSGIPYVRDFVVDKDSKKEKFHWSVGMLPQKDTSKPVTVMFGGNVTVFKTTPVKQAASWEWIKFFMDKDQTVEWAIKSGYMPTRKSAADAPALKQYWQEMPQSKQAFDLTKYARPEPNITAWQDIRTILENALTAVITGKATAKAALDDAASKANQLIQEKK